MSNGKTWVSAGLVFLGMRDLDIAEAGNQVVATFETLNNKVTGLRILSETTARINSERFSVWLNIETDFPVPRLSQTAPLYLAVHIAANDGAIERSDRDNALAHILKALQSVVAADYVRWVSSEALLPSVDFMAATRSISVPVYSAPRRRPPEASRPGPRRGTLPTVEETNTLLHSRLTREDVLDVEEKLHADLRSIFRDEQEEREFQRKETAAAEAKQRDRLRLSAWFFSIAVAILALPVGVALIIINFFKGEDLRLNSQAAALTGLFVALGATGATDTATSVLLGLVG